MRIPTRNHPGDFFRVIERTDLNTNRVIYSTDLLHERGKMQVIIICAYDWLNRWAYTSHSNEILLSNVLVNLKYALEAWTTTHCHLKKNQESNKTSQRWNRRHRLEIENSIKHGCKNWAISCRTQNSLSWQQQLSNIVCFAKVFWLLNF